MLFNRLSSFFIAIVVALTSAQAIAAKEIGDVEGIWQTFDIQSNKYLQIEISYEAYTNSFVGHIKALGRDSGLSAKSVCKKCPRPYTNKKVLGIQSLWGLKPEVRSNGQFTGRYHKGFILNPKSGSLKRVILSVSSNKKILKATARGKGNKVGSVQTWMRIK